MPLTYQVLLFLFSVAAPASRAPSKPAVSTLTDEEIETKGRATLDEYLNIRDMKVCMCTWNYKVKGVLHVHSKTPIPSVTY